MFAAVYEGAPEAGNATQKDPKGSCWAAGADPTLRASGVRFVPVVHQDCSRKSEEEALRIGTIQAAVSDCDSRCWLGLEASMDGASIFSKKFYGF
jgi:hypothetical protein